VISHEDESSGGFLRIMDVSNPAHPQEIGHFDTPGDAHAVAVSGDLAFIADWGSGLRIVDVSDPARPCEVGYYDTTGYFADIAVSGSHAFVTLPYRGIYVLDVSNPAQPIMTGHHYAPGSYSEMGVDVSGQYVFVAAYRYLGIYDCSEALGVQEWNETLPVSFTLSPAYPNPFNSTTTITYSLPLPTDVSLAVYDPLGRRITTLFDGYRQAGFHSLNLNANDLSSGLYFLRLEGSGLMATRKVILIR